MEGGLFPEAGKKLFPARFRHRDIGLAKDNATSFYNLYLVKINNVREFGIRNTIKS
jgi:hypothetical protein